MNKTASIILIVCLMFAHIIIALIYNNNQIISTETEELLSQVYSNHYSENLMDFSNDTLPTLIFSIPMRLYENICSPFISVTILHLISFILLFSGLKTLLHKNTMMWFSAIYLLSPWLLYNSNLEYISCLELGTACFILSIIKLNYYNQIDNSSSNQELWMFWLIVSIAWCMQFHFSFIILLITTIILVIKKIIKVKFWGACWGIAIAAISFLPIIVSPEKIPTTYSQILNPNEYYGYGIAHVYPTLKGILYWLRFSTTMGSNDVLVNTSFDWISNNSIIALSLKNLWLFITFVCGALTLLFSLCCNYIVMKKSFVLLFSKKIIDNEKNLLCMLTVSAFIGAVCYAMFVPFLLNADDMIIVADFALIPTLLIIDRYYKTKQSYHLLWVACIVSFLVFFNLSAAIESADYSTNSAMYEKITEISNKVFN